MRQSFSELYEALAIPAGSAISSHTAVRAFAGGGDQQLAPEDPFLLNMLQSIEISADAAALRSDVSSQSGLPSICAYAKLEDWRLFHACLFGQLSALQLVVPCFLRSHVRTLFQPLLPCRITIPGLILLTIVF